jgi:glycosyltransferase involved in cell wall biosynthesis
MQTPPPGPALPQPNALLFFLAHQDSYRKPLFSKKEIFVGPDTDTRAAPSRTFALRSPVGSYDVAQILSQLPSDQQPELVVVKADATKRNLPRNLGQLRCAKILLVGDTHHFQAPVCTLIDYARAEPFDFIIFDHTRHHAHWFAQAGLKNLHWIPALDFGFVPRELKPAPARPLTFVGQVGRHHPWRCAVLAEVKAAGLPLEILRGKLQETADLYADSQVTLNVSLNGDLNLRVFEALSAGGFLLTDELAPASGLPLLFEAGKHLDTWRSPGELVEKIRHYLAHPAEARRIRAAGQAELFRAHRPEVKLREFHDLVHSGRVNPAYDLNLDPRVSVGFGAAGAGFVAANEQLPAYEFLQELHRQSAAVTVFAPPARLPALAALADLPRLRFAPHEAMSVEPPALTSLSSQNVLWLEEPGQVALLARFTGCHLVAPTSLARELGVWGYGTAERKSPHGLFTRSNLPKFLEAAWQAGVHDLLRHLLPDLQARAETSAAVLQVADYAGRLELRDLYAAGVRRAIALDRDNQSAILQMAGLALEAQDEVATCLSLEEAARLGPLPAEIGALRAQLSAKHGAHDSVSSHALLTHLAPVTPAAQPRRILVVTNLFPPQELGGYGRMIWEFAHGLRQRGHAVKVLTGQAGYLAKTPTADEADLEQHVSRSLDLIGHWREGRPQIEPDLRKVANRVQSNARKVADAARGFGADAILLGNLDFLGAPLLHAALDAGYPVLHALANAGPGYTTAEQPVAAHYCVAACSDWNARAFRSAGYTHPNLETLYPGARLDRFYRLFLPDLGKLRVAYASLVMPYKGAHVLVQALAHLHRAGLDFSAEIAGDTTDPKFVEQLRQTCRDTGMAHKVRFTGFLDRVGLAALFARSNVLVFPSQFEEPFGISQVEALAAGLVVVSSGTGGAKEIVRHGQDGLLFPAKSDTALAQQLHALATQPDLFARLQQQGQLRALDFSVDAAVHRIETLAGHLLTPQAATTAA